MTNEQIKPESNSAKAWLTLLGISATIFFVVGTAMLLIDQKYLGGIQYLSSSILFFVAMYLINKNKIDVRSSESSTLKYLQMGFIFTVIGLSLNIAVWALGIILFVKGLLKKEDH